LERTYGFVERIGIGEIRAIIVDDTAGIASRLEADLARSAAAYRDPWKELRAAPAANQFNSLLPVIQ
ncbi:MAG TPA: hypothetical protein VH477_07240, partial [Bryobacteraceae bacterium]